MDRVCLQYVPEHVFACMLLYKHTCMPPKCGRIQQCWNDVLRTCKHISEAFSYRNFNTWLTHTYLCTQTSVDQVLILHLWLFFFFFFRCLGTGVSWLRFHWSKHLCRGRSLQLKLLSLPLYRGRPHSWMQWLPQCVRGGDRGPLCRVPSCQSSPCSVLYRGCQELQVSAALDDDVTTM